MKKQILVIILALLFVTAMPTYAQEGAGGSTRITTEVPDSHSLTVHYNDGGTIKNGGETIPNGSALSVPRHQNAVLDLRAQQGFKRVTVYVNGVAQAMNGDMLTLTNITEDTYLAASYVPNDVPENVNFRVTLSGHIIYQDGRPAANKAIELHSEPQTTTSDSKGSFGFDNAAIGAHTLKVYDDTGRVAGSLDFRIDCTNQTGLVTPVTLPDGSVSFWVNPSVVSLNMELMLDDAGHLTLSSVSALKGSSEAGNGESDSGLLINAAAKDDTINPITGKIIQNEGWIAFGMLLLMILVIGMTKSTAKK